jgi:hypothetical protein
MGLEGDRSPFGAEAKKYMELYVFSPYLVISLSFMKYKGRHGHRQGAGGSGASKPGIPPFGY